MAVGVAVGVALAVTVAVKKVPRELENKEPDPDMPTQETEAPCSLTNKFKLKIVSYNDYFGMVKPKAVKSTQKHTNFNS